MHRRPQALGVWGYSLVASLGDLERVTVGTIFGQISQSRLGTVVGMLAMTLPRPVLLRPDYESPDALRFCRYC